MSNFVARHPVAALCCLMSCVPAFADHVVDADTPTDLPDVIVEAAPIAGRAVDRARDSLRSIPGAVSLVTAEDYEHRYALNVRDMLREVPGVFAQQRFAEEVRLSVRGSGLGRSNHLRGILLLQDGVPVNLPDGFGDFQEVDPLAVRYLEVYKGANGLRYGSSTLGGAVNLVMPTALTVNQPMQVRVEGGSFDTYREHLAISKVLGSWDGYAAVTANQADGFREQSHTDNRRLSGNVGYQFRDGVQTRFYLNLNDINQQLPGTLDYETAVRAPRLVVPTATQFDTGRDVDSVRLANKTRFDLENGHLEAGAYYFHKKLYHPVTGVLVDQVGDFFGGFVHWDTSRQWGGYRNDLQVGARVGAGINRARLFTNDGGHRGSLLSDGDEEASELTLYAEHRLWLGSDLALISSVQGVHAERDFRDRRNASESAQEDFNGVNPKLGVLWQLRPQMQVFANLSRSFEPPIFSDLNQTSAVGSCDGTGVGGFADLDAQRAWTAELGSRGEQGRWQWDLAVYRAELRDEMLQKACSPTVAIQFNAARTVHQGLEAGLEVLLFEGVGVSGDALRLRQAYTYSDFHFDDDRDYGDNQLAGQPQHYYQASLRYQHPSGWYLAPSVERAMSATPVDYANTKAVPGYTVWGLSAGVELPRGISLFLEARNLGDERYISSVSATTDFSTAGNRNIFYPGEGRALFGGLRLELGA